MAAELRLSLPHAGLAVGWSYRAGDETWLYLGHDGDQLLVFDGRAIRAVALPDAGLAPSGGGLDLVAFGAALAACIAGDDLRLRELALEVVACAPAPPPGVAGAIAARLEAARRAPLERDSLLAVMALFNVAEQATGSRDTIAAIAGSLKRSRQPAAVAMREAARPVIDRMDRALDAWRARADGWRRELEEMARTGRFEEALARLAEWYPDDLPDGGVTHRAAICEEVGDRLREIDPAAARWLLRTALDNARIWASWSTSGGEGLSRMVDVDRLAAKQIA
jgi:hypothetical protein